MRLRALDPLLYHEEDVLHKEFVSRFYNLIINSIETPYAISVDGLWGTGKTTVMQKIRDKLRDANYPIFWFNPWKYRQTENVVLAFLKCLGDAHKDIIQEMSEHGSKILRVLVEAGMDVLLKSITSLSLGDIKSYFESVEARELPLYDQYQDTIGILEKEFVELINRISEKNENRPVVIFFDDLDRCLPNDTIKLLEALKNLFVTKWDDPEENISQKCNAIFICGIDTHIAKQFIREHYHGIEEIFAINYFRKIFNTTISMPRSPDIKNLLLRYIEDLYEWTDSEEEKASTLATMVIMQGLHTQIHSVRKYLNVISNFYTFLKFNPEYAFTPEKDFVVTLLILKEAWQPLYEKLVDKALRERSEMEILVENLINQGELSTEQKQFLVDFLGKDTTFAKEVFSNWLVQYPTLA